VNPNTIIPNTMNPNARVETLEHGDRHAFLSRVATFALRDHVDNAAHPLPDPALADGLIPVGYRTLDANDLEASYIRNATAALLHVHRFPARVPPEEFLRTVIADEHIKKAVVSAEPLAQQVGRYLSALGVVVEPHGPSESVDADLGVTSPLVAIAATGSLVQNSTAEGGRGASLVPRLHLALLPVSRIVATTADVLSTFGAPGSAFGSMPANVTLISGPSRTGDIEMILTVGVHGPRKVFIALLDD
jgi:L-lactate dehydrogenase complex protein LldG